VTVRNGLAYVGESTMKLTQLVSEQRANVVSPEELHLWHPYLTLGEIYGALSYYWDHQAEVDAEIARIEAFVDSMQARLPEPSAIARIREAHR
jgi:hypothetical protein